VAVAAPAPAQSGAPSPSASRSPAPPPCGGVDRTLSAARKAALAPVIAKQLEVQRVDVRQSFGFDGWSVIGVSTHQADDAYLFYSHPPPAGKYVTLWAGAAAPNEQNAIARWVAAHANGIPATLASCFAWYVTHGSR